MDGTLHEKTVNPLQFYILCFVLCWTRLQRKQFAEYKQDESEHFFGAY